jgi:PTS system nitrogen regulatory IIA component
MPAKIQISDFLKSSRAWIDVHALHKKHLLTLLSQHAARVLGFTSAPITNAILRREAIGSTGVGDGIALPHARLTALQRPLGTLARLREAVDFGADDRKPVSLVFLVLLPADEKHGPFNALACAARVLRQPRVLSRLRAAQSDAEFYEAITSTDRR